MNITHVTQIPEGQEDNYIPVWCGSDCLCGLDDVFPDQLYLTKPQCYVLKDELAQKAIREEEA